MTRRHKEAVVSTPHPPDVHQLGDYTRHYEEDRYGGSFGAYLKDLEVRRFVDLAGYSRGHVVDVGTGTGKLASAFAGPGHITVGVDRSGPMLAEARRRCGCRIVLVSADAGHLAFPSKSFGTVVSSRLLMHVDAWDEVIAELCRVSSGVVVLDFPSSRSLARLDSLAKRVHPPAADSPRQTYRTFSLRQIQRSFSRCEFKVVEIRRGFCLPAMVHRRLNRPALSRPVERILRALGFARLIGSPVTVKAVRRGTSTAAPRSRSASDDLEEQSRW